MRVIKIRMFSTQCKTIRHVGSYSRPTVLALGGHFREMRHVSDELTERHGTDPFVGRACSKDR